MGLPAEILDESGALFHDARPEAIDPEAHAEYVIQRVLDRGSMRSVGALVRAYGKGRIEAFFRDGGVRRVSPRTARLWLLYLGLTEEECTPRSSPRIRSPFWSE